MSWRPTFLLAAAVVAVACNKDGNDSSDSADTYSMPYCEDTPATMAPADVSAFGLSGQDFLDSLPAQLDGTASFDDSVETDLQVLLSVDASSLRMVDSEAVYPTSGVVATIDVICPDRVEVDAQVQLLTADGRLAETLDVVLRTDDPAEMGAPLGQVYFSSDLDPDGLSGSLDLGSLYDLSGYTEVSMGMHATLLDGVLAGSVDAQGETVSGQTASVELLEVASLSAVAAE